MLPTSCSVVRVPEEGNGAYWAPWDCSEDTVLQKDRALDEMADVGRLWATAGAETDVVCPLVDDDTCEGCKELIKALSSRSASGDRLVPKMAFRLTCGLAASLSVESANSCMLLLLLVGCCVGVVTLDCAIVAA